MSVHSITIPEYKKQKLLIFGASGKTGQELVRQALERGHIVTAYVRRPEGLTFSHPCLKVIQGELHDYSLLNNTVRNQDAVLSALGASSPFKYDASLVEGMSHIIRAMEVNHVRRLIYMSFAGVKDARSRAGFIIRYIAPFILKTEIRGHELRERQIVLSFSDWTIIRPVTLTNKKSAGSFRTGETITARKFPATISRSGVAAFMLQQVTDDRFKRKKPLLMS